MDSLLDRYGHKLGLTQYHGRSGKSLGELPQNHSDGEAANMLQTPWVAAFVVQGSLRLQNDFDWIREDGSSRFVKIRMLDYVCGNASESRVNRQSSQVIHVRLK
ncbi:hypothetical protein J3459_009862 [Metarhizium acridum]|uniref:uncharacterized protein n=1 Tax=Metarhizium acridum TaxID=92637 RepID=UPI001C6B2FDF|nr:hypothetical protein J3459_009862 [Metarhizium acridum]KAG8424773.1 hypothetical protein J3458_001537 [Metarhizium acridum]